MIPARELINDSNFFITPNGNNPQEYSAHIDEVLGFNINEIEKNLLGSYKAYYSSGDLTDEKKHYQGTQAWIGLDPQTLLTPYEEIKEFLELVQKYPIESVVDLGAGYGRVAIVMNAVMPKAKFKGYEVLDVRVDETQRIFKELELDETSQIETTNILDKTFEMPKADLYFIYDFSDPVDLKVILNQLSDKMYKEKFFVVARGAGIRSLIQNKYPEFWACHGVIHREKWSLYSSYTDLDS